MAARAYVASRSFRLRLRFTGALLLLVLPLLAAAWGFGKYAASNERAKTDIGLHASLRTAATEFARIAEPDKPSWNLEPWRPVVTESEMVDSRCNPGGPESAET